MKQKWKDLLPGLRAVKTAIAVFLCLAVQFLFQRENAFYSGIAAVICMQPVPKQSVHTGLFRLAGTLIGGVMGFFLVELAQWIPGYQSGWYLLVIPAGFVVCITVCLVFRCKGAGVICCIVFLNIATHFERTIDSNVLYVIDRMIDTTIGVFAAIVVNWMIKPQQGPKKEEKSVALKDGGEE